MQPSSLIRITFAQLEERAKERPSGYIEEVRKSAATEDREAVWLDKETYAELQDRYSKLDPGWFELARNYTIATARYVAAGMPTVPEEQFKERLTACETCELWSGHNCRLCGCPRKKLEWATETCPHPDGSRWKVD